MSLKRIAVGIIRRPDLIAFCMNDVLLDILAFEIELEGMSLVGSRNDMISFERNALGAGWQGRLFLLPGTRGTSYIPTVPGGCPHGKLKLNGYLVQI